MNFESRIIEIVKNALNEDVLSISKADAGLDNFVYFIRTDKKSLVIRFAKEDFDMLKAHVYAFQKWYSLGIPVPTIIDASYDYVLESRISGSPLVDEALSENQTRILVEDLAIILKKIHSCNTSGFGYIDELGIGKDDSWTDTLNKYLPKRINEFNKNPYADQSTKENVKNYLKKNLSITKIDKSVLIHKDFSLGNIMINDGKLSGIIDASDTMAGDPMFDVASVYEMFDKKYFEYFKKIYPAINMDKIYYYAIIMAMRYINYFYIKNDKEKLSYHMSKLKLILGKEPI